MIAMMVAAVVLGMGGSGSGGGYDLCGDGVHGGILKGFPR